MTVGRTAFTDGPSGSARGPAPDGARRQHDSGGAEPEEMVCMTEREKMLSGQLYDCGDEELLAQWHRAKDLIRMYNNASSADAAGKENILRELLGGKGDNLWITAPFFVDYGKNIYFGNNCEVNMNCTFLDDNVIASGTTPSLLQTCRYIRLFIRQMPLTDLENPKTTVRLNFVKLKRRRSR